MRCTRAICMIVMGATIPAAAEREQHGILDRPAPGWEVEKWLNLPEGTPTLDVADFRGKVLYLYCFQSWCPGCHRHGFPTLQNVMKQYENEDDVAFVAVQTVFEGYASNTFEHARKVAGRYNLEIPIGQSGESEKASHLMRRYRTGGTPWTVIIDRDGVVRFNDFHIDADHAKALIDKHRARPVTSPGADVPVSRGGRDMVGKPLPLDGLRWLNTKNRRPLPTKGTVTLVRWWTDTCGYCERSLPAITQLERRFGRRGFQTIGVYHPKPPRDVADATILKAAADFGYKGPVAVDRNWHTLEKLYLSRARRPATSVSFLLDRNGIVRFVHPGPVFAPSKDPKERRLDADFKDIEAAIRALLSETPKAAEATNANAR